MWNDKSPPSALKLGATVRLNPKELLHEAGRGRAHGVVGAESLISLPNTPSLFEPLKSDKPAQSSTRWSRTVHAVDMGNFQPAGSITWNSSRCWAALHPHRRLTSCLIPGLLQAVWSCWNLTGRKKAKRRGYVTLNETQENDRMLESSFWSPMWTWDEVVSHLN